MSAVLKVEPQIEHFEVNDIVVCVDQAHVCARALVIEVYGSNRIQLQMYNEDGDITERSKEIRGSRLADWRVDPVSTKLLSLLRIQASE